MNERILDLICKFNSNDCEECELHSCKNCTSFVNSNPMRAIEYIPKSNIVDTIHLGYYAYIISIDSNNNELFVFNRNYNLVYNALRKEKFEIEEVHDIIEDIDRI